MSRHHCYSSSKAYRIKHPSYRNGIELHWQMFSLTACISQGLFSQTYGRVDCSAAIFFFFPMDETEKSGVRREVYSRQSRVGLKRGECVNE